MKTDFIKDNNFQVVAESVKPDAKKRVVLPKVLNKPGITYRVYSNSIGQIILDPQVSIPASELWLYENPEALAGLKQGLKEAAEGKLSKVNLDDL
ncbi:MAG: hypothetical protein PHF74_02255 [Dehalococcoidales bacterium]|nr:hypothetical protein [Dehalococcoidales bacterium]